MIDFSKAPEGTTHYGISDVGAVIWYRVVGADVRMWLGQLWFPAKQYKDGSAFTPTPKSK